MSTGDRWTCRAYCRGCGVRVYSVQGLPECSRPDVERLLVWIRANTRRAHCRANPDCRGFVLRWDWERFVPTPPKLPKHSVVQLRRAS